MIKICIIGDMKISSLFMLTSVWLSGWITLTFSHFYSNHFPSIVDPTFINQADLRKIDGRREAAQALHMQSRDGARAKTCCFNSFTQHHLFSFYLIKARNITGSLPGLLTELTFRMLFPLFIVIKSWKQPFKNNLKLCFMTGSNVFTITKR